MARVIGKTRRVLSLVIALVAVFFFWFPFSSGAHAQGTEATDGSIALSTLLDRVPTPTRGVLMAVNADHEKRPIDPALVSKQSPSLTEVVAAFGMKMRRFGRVTVVAPDTMVQINTDLRAPRIFEDLPKEDLLTLLASSLTDAQWAKLTSRTGIGFSDLSGEVQRQLFQSLLNASGHSVISSRVADLPPQFLNPSQRTLVGDIRADLPACRLRLGQRVMIQVSLQRKKSGGSPLFTARGVATSYTLGSDQPVRYRLIASDDDVEAKREPDTLFGVPVRFTVPNAPRQSQLDAGIATSAPIPLQGITTVGGLIQRIGAISKTEIYADKRYETRHLTIQPAASAPARDLLPALAFCLQGAYRKVGSAFVLTEDVVGVGTRRQRWAEFVKDVDAQRKGVLQQARSHLYTRQSPRELPYFDDSLRYSAEQKGRLGKRASDLFPELATDLELRFSELTPVQQDAARRIVEQVYQDQPKLVENGLVPMLDEDIHLLSNPTLEMLVPSLDRPVDMGFQLSPRSLFDVPQALYEQRLAERQNEDAPVPIGDSTDSLAMLRTFKHRALLVPPGTGAEEIEKLVPGMQRMGLNELWLVVRPDSRGEDTLDATLTSALAATAGTDISVMAVFDVFTGWTAPPALSQDQTILGESSLQAAARQKKRMGAFNTTTNGLPSGNVVVSPFAPEVQNTLRNQLPRIARLAGLAGIVWRDTAPPGYNVGSLGLTEGPEAQLGYSTEARLRFLRQTHVDPLDVTVTDSQVEHLGLATRPDIRLPLFDDAALDKALLDKWRQFRSDTNRASLQALFRSVLRNGTEDSQVPIWVQQRRPLGDLLSWYGTWDRPEAPLPNLDEPFFFRAPTLSDLGREAKSLSQQAVYAVPRSVLAQPKDLQTELLQVFQANRWDGFVLDLNKVAEADRRDLLARFTEVVDGFRSSDPSSDLN